MQLTVNGTRTELAESTTVATLVAERADQDHRVAVAVNSEVVSRSAWANTVLSEGDSVEVLTAVAGG